MPGGRQRRLSWLYRASQSDGPSTRSGRRRREPSPQEEEEVEEEVPATPEAQRQEEAPLAEEAEEEDEQEEDEADGCSGASGVSTPYLRGPASLPALPARARRPVITPIGQRYMF